MTVLVTGIGLVTPLASGREETFQRVLRGERAFGPVTLFPDAGYRVHRAAEIPTVDGAEPDPHASRSARMALSAAEEALSHANLLPDTKAIALFVGGTTAGMFETEALLAALLEDPNAKAPLERMLSHPLSSVAAYLNRKLGPFSQRTSTCAACASGALAIALGAEYIEAGRGDVVLAGGADGLCRLTLGGFGALGLLSNEGTRPFDKSRNGIGLGEGAAFVVLESAQRAEGRGATPIAYLSGWANGSEAHHPTQPEPSGRTMVRLMQGAMDRANVRAKDIGYVNAHGTGTRANDLVEARSLRSLFGEHLSKTRVSSSKGALGHALGASGAIEAALCALCLRDGVVLPTAGLREVDPECALPHVTACEARALDHAMSSSFGFGGLSSVLVLSHPRVKATPSPRRGPCPVYVGAVAGYSPLGFFSLETARTLLVSGGSAPRPSRSSFLEEDLAELDPERARRMGTSGRWVARLAVHVGVGSSVVEGCGLVVGQAYGAADRAASNVSRLLEKGARMMSPLEFPHLVPSAPAAEAAMYLGIHGEVSSLAALSRSGEAALEHALLAVERGAPHFLAAAVEPESPLIERVFGVRGDLPRGYGGAVVALSREPSPLCVRKLSRGDPLRDAFPNAARLCATPIHEGVQDSRYVLRRELGVHEAFGLLAFAAGCSLVHTGEAAAVVVDSEEDAFLIERAT